MDLVCNKKFSNSCIPEFFKLSMCQTNEQSIFYLAGISFLRIYVIGKFITGLPFDYVAKFTNKLSILYEFAKTINKEPPLNAYRLIITTLDTATNISDAFSWLDGYVSLEQFGNIQKDIIITGSVIFNYLAIQNNNNLTKLLAEEPVIALSWLTDYFHAYFKVIWDTGLYLCNLQCAETAPIVYIYYSSENNLFGLLHHQSEGTQAQLEHTINFNPLVYYVENSRDLNEANLTDDRRVDDSINLELLNLIDLMAVEICNWKLYSEEMQQALYLAASVQPQLKELKCIKELLESHPYCQKHYSNEVIKIDKCDKLHCRECMFEIFNLLTKENYIINCPCGNRLPLIRIKEIQKTQDYLEFKQKYNKFT